VRCVNNLAVYEAHAKQIAQFDVPSIRDRAEARADSHRVNNVVTACVQDQQQRLTFVLVLGTRLQARDMGVIAAADRSCGVSVPGAHACLMHAYFSKRWHYGWRRVDVRAPAWTCSRTYCYYANTAAAACDTMAELRQNLIARQRLRSSAPFQPQNIEDYLVQLSATGVAVTQQGSPT
jgi:hypothetical protein